MLRWHGLVRIRDLTAGAVFKTTQVAGGVLDTQRYLARTG